METNQQFIEHAVPQRPVFLTVLCILTFIGSGWGIINGITKYMNAAEVAARATQVIEDRKERLKDSDIQVPSFVSGIFNSAANASTVESIHNSSLIHVIQCLLTLIGGTLMFTLRKMGFYIYVAGIILGIVGSLIIIGGTVGIITAATSLIVGIAFIAMYSANLKAMVN